MASTSGPSFARDSSTEHPARLHPTLEHPPFTGDPKARSNQSLEQVSLQQATSEATSAHHSTRVPYQDFRPPANGSLPPTVPPRLGPVHKAAAAVPLSLGPGPRTTAKPKQAMPAVLAHPELGHRPPEAPFHATDLKPSVLGDDTHLTNISMCLLVLSEHFDEELNVAARPTCSVSVVLTNSNHLRGSRERERRDKTEKAEPEKTEKTEKTIPDKTDKAETAKTETAESAVPEVVLTETEKSEKAESAEKAENEGRSRLSLHVLDGVSEEEKIARQLFNEQFVLILPEEYTLFLASPDPEASAIRRHYMDMFDCDANLLQATRTLCQKLHLKGESQEIDRLLLAFTKLYLQQHPVNVFCTTDFEKVYIVLYSLILLNTALHNADARARISQVDYIKNTMATFVLQRLPRDKPLLIRQRMQIERELAYYYEDLARHKLHLKRDGDVLTVAPRHLQKPQENLLTRQQSNSLLWLDMRNRRAPASSAVSTVSTLASPTVNARFGFNRALVLDARPRAKPSRRGSFDTQHSYGSAQDFFDDSNDRLLCDVGDFNADDFQDAVDLQLELNGAPYLKEGLLRLRILNNDNTDTALTLDPPMLLGALAMSSSTTKSGFFSMFRNPWHKEPTVTLGTHSSNAFAVHKLAEYFVVVSKGELRLFSFDPKVIKKHQAKVKKLRKQHMFGSLPGPNDMNVGDGNWLNSAAHIGDYNLCATVAAIERPNHMNFSGSATTLSPSGKVTWTLLFPRVTKKPAKKFIFEAGTEEVAAEFVNTCNFWASKLTAVPPLEETILSIEYGWTDIEHLLSMGDQFKKTRHIHRWEPLPEGTYLSNHISNMDSGNEGMMKQFMLTLRYYNSVKAMYSAFSREKAHYLKNLKHYDGCSNQKLVVANYELRSAEYKAKLNKYKTYSTMLGYGLRLRLDLEHKTEEEEWLRELGSPDDPHVQAEIAKRRQRAFESKPELYKATCREMLRLNRNQALYPVGVKNPLPVLENKSLFNSSTVTEGTLPIKQLMHVDKALDEPALTLAKKELMMSFSTNIISEEEEPEDVEEHKAREPQQNFIVC